MTGRIITSDGKTYDLPALLEWNLLRTGGVPCDSFSVTCLYTPDMAAALHKAVSFLARTEGGTVLLHGMVDEYEIELGESGRTVTITGRGYAARLLDNEARPVTYAAASLKDIVRTHVTPYGIACKSIADVRANSVYTVASGESQWRALDDFCRTYGGFSPTFTPTGELIAAKETGGKTLALDGSAPLVKLTKRENHYGVLSEVLVIDKTRGTSYSVKNADFLSRGGCRRKVLYTPGQSTWSAMRYTGEYQIAQSKTDEVVVSAVLAGTVSADPGDTVTVDAGGIGGTCRVYATEHALSEAGETTTLTLKEEH